jgi:hypothetical protein
MGRNEKTTRVIFYPAVADSVDLPDLLFFKSKDEAKVSLLSTEEQHLLFGKDATLLDRLKMILATMGPVCKDSDLIINIIGSRAPLLKVRQSAHQVIADVHWNIVTPYFSKITRLPIAHPEILDIFADAVFQYAAFAMKHPQKAKSALRNMVVDAYRLQPLLLLATLNIFNKPNLYHIHPTRTWFDRTSAANDRYQLEIDVSAVEGNPLVSAELLAEVTGFIHKIVKNYAFRYAYYLWTQQFKIVFGVPSCVDMATHEGKDIVINIHPLIHQSEWKPALYLSLGYAIMLTILRSSGRADGKEIIYLAMMKTWKRYLSYDETEQQQVRDVYGFSPITDEQQLRCLSESMIGKKNLDFLDDFLTLMNYSFKETFLERIKGLNERYKRETVVYVEQLWITLRNINTPLIRHNINHGKLIEILRSDDIDHLQLANFLRTGCLGRRKVVDVDSWLLLRTLLYDIINAPKVFQNDYKMLLKILTKVNKSLIVFIWTLGLDHDAHYEVVSRYISKLMNDIFVFDRVKIYEIVSDPLECLEAEAMTGYLLNWASYTPDKRRSIIEAPLSALPKNVVTQLRVQTSVDVDQVIRMMGVGASGLLAFCLHQAYRWGSTGDELTERIRDSFPKLLKQAQEDMRPSETIRGGAMLLLLLAQIISDERDGFAGNITITEEERRIVRNLITQCLDWNQRHFVMMVAGIAAGYVGSIDEWILQQFDILLARYDGGDRVMLRSVVQFDVEKIIERTLMTAREGEEGSLQNKLQRLRFNVDPVVSDQANKFLGAMASRCDMQAPERILKKRDIRELVLELSLRMKAQIRYRYRHT